MPYSPAFIEGLGGPELMLIMFVVLLLFGADKLPELARGFGKSMREFKKAASGVEEEVRRAMEEAPPAPTKKTPSAQKALTPPPTTTPGNTLPAASSSPAPLNPPETPKSDSPPYSD